MIVRNFSFSFEEKDLFTYTTRPRLTRILNSLSILFPVGERFFVQSIRNVENRIIDENLITDIAIFKQQEGRHSREHTKLNKLLENHNIPVKTLEAQALKRLTKYGNNEENALLVTACLEAYTEAMGWLVPKLKFAFKDNDYCKLWEYHAIEEQEHAHVAREILDLLYDVSIFKKYKYYFLTGKELIAQLLVNYKELKRI